VKITTCEPTSAALLSGAEFVPHKIQGWTPDFVPEVLNRDVAGSLLKIDEIVARDTARRLAQEEGLFVGLSAGGTVAGALEVAKQAKEGEVLLAMLPDTGERYFSTILFEGVNEGSDDDWLGGL
jgi:cysteine synthase A